MSATPRDPTGLEPAKPRGIVRLNRRGLWALGVIVVSVGVAAVVALQAQGNRKGELRTASLPAPPPEARWYQKESDAIFEPTALPTAEPLARETPLPVLVLPDRGPTKNTLEARREQAFIRALGAKALVSEFQKGTGRLSDRSGQAPAGMTTPANVFPIAAQGASSGPGFPGEDPNLQERKEAFLKLDERAEVVGSRVRPPLSRFEIKAGSVIPAILVAGINSDLPGQTIAQVRENVFDTETGASLLVPQGTRVVGLYDSRVAYGQERVLVNWKRFVFPDGTSLSLQDGMPGADAAGYAGFSDQVDNHLMALFGRAILLSAITAGVELSQRGIESSSTGTGLSAADVASASLGQNLGQVATEVVRRSLNRQPTLVVRPGYRFNIMVTQDLVLPGPYPEVTPSVSARDKGEKE
jgi:type IV secretion system protein VirB10